jgi:hypothetical protein
VKLRNPKPPLLCLHAFIRRAAISAKSPDSAYTPKKGDKAYTRRVCSVLCVV